MVLGAFRMSAEGLYSNSWVRPSATGNLLYRHDEHGVRICDFSACGYKGGMRELPDVSRIIGGPNRFNHLLPVGGNGDDADRIQAALDAAGQLSLTNGFRGIVYLAAGDYRVSRPLWITNSGVVLQGAGNSQQSGSRIWATSPTQYTLIEITGPASIWPSEHKNYFAQALVPAGTRTFKLYDTADLAVSNWVTIVRPITSNWVGAVDMDLVDDKEWPNGTPEFVRQITRIDGPWVTVDTPLPQTFEQHYGGGFVQRIVADNRIENVGVEDLFLGSYFRTLPNYVQDEDHGWRAIRIAWSRDVWVRRVMGRHFGFSVVDLSEWSRNVTVAECRGIDPVSKITGNRRYPFHIDKGDHHLIRDCYSRDGRHSYAFGSRVPGPNANVRCQAEDAHADSGPHHRWAVGGLYDLIDENGTWFSELDYLGQAGINAQNRGNSTGGHGWAGAYMTVWNCVAPCFRVRNPPTARNWLIGSIGPIKDSLWNPFPPRPVGADPDGTYEWSGPAYVYFPPPGVQQPHPALNGRHVNPYSLYYAQFQQRLKWPQSEFRERWVGDIDEFGRIASPDDVAAVDADFLSKIRLAAGNLQVTSFLDHTPPHQLAFTFNVPLTGAERVMAASLVLCMKAVGESDPADALYLDDPVNGTPLRTGGYGWQITEDESTVETLEIDPKLLVDGQLNVSIKKNVALDWAVLHAQVSPVTANTQSLLPTDDTYTRGGDYREQIYGSEIDLVVKRDDDDDFQRKAYVMWSIESVTRPVVGATVRLYCIGNGQPGNVYYAAPTVYEAHERVLNWENQPGNFPPIAYFVPETGGFVEFSVLPQVLAARAPLADDRKISLQLWAPYDLGDSGGAHFASKEHPDASKRPQLILQFRNEPPKLQPLSNVAVTVNTRVGPLWLALSDAETPLHALILRGTSSNPSVIPDQNIVFGGSRTGDRNVTITPLTNQTGSAEITILVSDGVQTISVKFNIRVGVPNVPPGLSHIPDQVLAEHTSSSRIPFTVSDTYGRARDLTVSLDASFQPREPTVTVTFGSEDDPNGPPANVSRRYLVLTPAPRFIGTTTLSVRVSDGFTQTSQPFGVRVNAVDDPPGPVRLLEPDAGISFVPGQPLTLEATVVDSERDLARVEFHHATTRLGSVAAPPFRFVWANPPEGFQHVRAVAVDLAGQQTASPEVTFEIGEQYDSPPSLAIRLEGDYVTIGWDADGRSVQIQTSERLGSGANWTTVEPVIGPQGGTTVTIARRPSGARYYRLLVVP